jgi:hypothetical protein
VGDHFEVVEKPAAVDVRFDGFKVDIRNPATGDRENGYRFDATFDFKGELKPGAAQEENVQDAFVRYKPAGGAKKPILTVGLAVALAGLLLDLGLMLAGYQSHPGWGTGLTALLLPYFFYRLPMVLGYFKTASADYNLEQFRNDLRSLQGVDFSAPPPLG